ncbi:hypothetical protein ABI59_04370 [Acidobacteria bacterium Mor1]|nr:hypothetical protein ABI59_04370 [Acidobacteria bacterium Mor1]
MHETLIVGAGIAGLACARRLQEAGQSTMVVDKGRGVGGRCATRRVDGQSVDHGPAFLHGSAPGFVSALRETPGRRLEPWPAKVHGSGRPCQPSAFAPGQVRLAFGDGVNAFAKHLARDLDVERECRVDALAFDGDRFRVVTADGERRPSTLILSLPLEQTRGLLDTLGEDSPEIRGVRQLLSMVSTVPSLTILSGYAADQAAPDWDVCYPEDSPVLQMIAHDSAKRATPRSHVLVAQAHPRWSRRELENDPDGWKQAMLVELERVTGLPESSRLWCQAHRWRYARLDAGSELAQPLMVQVAGARLGLCGELFSPGNGVEAAWLSGTRLAERIIGERDWTATR